MNKIDYFRQYYFLNKKKIELKRHIWLANNKERVKDYQEKYQKIYRNKFSRRVLKQKKLDKEIEKNKLKVEMFKKSLNNLV